LLSDVDHTVGRAYGVEPGPESRHPDYARRLTFLIDPNGVIAGEWQVADIPAHPDEVLAEIRSRSGTT
jgi:peroxiredoxin